MLCLGSPGRTSNMRDEEMGGEAACLLSQVSADGRLSASADLIRISTDPIPGAWNVSIGSEGDEFQISLPQLARRSGENAAAYQARLEEPLARSLIWHLVLRAQDQPVAIVTDQPALYAPLLTTLLSLLG